MRGKRKQALIGLLAASTLAALGSSVPAAAAPARTFEVTITNLVPGQPLTPPVISTHSSFVHIFQVGGAASFEVKEIAENGNTAPLIASLGSGRRVFDVEAGSFPLVATGTPFPSSVTLTIQAAGSAKFLSWESMLICTNDGFTGLDGVLLPRLVGESATILTAGYDAGTELNTEDLADIVPPCQGLVGVADDQGAPGTGVSNPALAEGGVIHHHPNIQGGSDLVPAVHGWTDPVAEVTITRVS